MDKVYYVAVIGAGNRSMAVVKNLLEAGSGRVRIGSVYDPDRSVVDFALKNFWPGEMPLIADSAEAAINAPGIDWVMVFSPNAFHREHILAGFAAGKDVFSEKPLATSIEGCQEIYEAHKKSGRVFATGFVLRYANIYRKTKEMLSSGRFGYILAIEANEHIRSAHGGYIMCNWRRHTSLAGPHILEKCCHDLDLINWFAESVPSRVAAFGGRNFFRPENSGLMEKYGRDMFHCWRDPQAIPSPFTDDTDLMDNTMAVAEFRNGIRVTFSATMNNAIPERRMSFICSEGNLKLDLYDMKLHYRQLGDEGVTTLTFEGDSHGGGDDYIMKELFETMSKGVPPKCSGAEGLRSAVYAMAIDQAVRTHQVVELEPVWKKLDV